MFTCEENLVAPSLKKLNTVLSLLVGIMLALSYFISATIYLLSVISVLLFMGIVLYNRKIRSARSVVVFGDITCGEITDLLKFLDRIISGLNIPLLFWSFSLNRIEECIRKLERIDPDLTRDLVSLLDSYAILGSIRKSRRRFLMISVSILLLILFTWIGMYIVLIVGFFDYFFILFLPMVFMIILMNKGLSIYEPMGNIYEMPPQDLDKLTEITIKLIDLITQKISKPLIIKLMSNYPQTRIEHNYTVISPKIENQS